MKKTEIEYKLIRNDFIDLLTLVKLIREIDQVGILYLALLPVFGFFVEESNKYFESHNFVNQNIALVPRYKQIFTKLRLLLKQFDEKFGGKSNFIQTLDSFQHESTFLFNSDKTGLYGLLAKKYLQPDIGLYFTKAAPFFLTNIGFSVINHFSFSKTLVYEENIKNIKALMFDFGIALGEYFSIMINLLNVSNTFYEIEASVNPQSTVQFTHIDFLSSILYKQVQKKLKLLDKEITPSVLFIISQINFVSILLPKFVPNNSDLLLRIQFLVLYHSVRSLLSIRNKIDLELVEILEITDISTIPNSQKLRNILAHYGLGKGIQNLTGKNVDGLDNVIITLTRITKFQLSSIVERNLNIISGWANSKISRKQLNLYRAFFGSN